MTSYRNVAFFLVLALIAVACTPAVAPAADQPAETVAESAGRERSDRGRCLPRTRRHTGS